MGKFYHFSSPYRLLLVLEVLIQDFETEDCSLLLHSCSMAVLELPISSVAPTARLSFLWSLIIITNIQDCPTPTNKNNLTSFMLGALMHHQPAYNLREKQIINRDQVNHNPHIVALHEALSNKFVTYDNFSELTHHVCNVWLYF